jgi:tripeptide aminopeptidase
MAAILYALERAVNSGLPLKPFTVAFTTRGKGNMAGVKHLVLPKRVRCAFVFGSELAPGTYTASSPGIALFSADVLGRSSDASDPENGVSAISIAAKAIAQLSLGRHDPETTSNIGTITGGAATATVPLAALVRGQVRASEAEKALPVLEHIKTEFQKSAAAAGGAVSFKWFWDFQPYIHAHGSEVLRLAEWALKDSGLTPTPVSSSGGNEANALNARGVFAVSFGIGARTPKPNDEYILLEHLAKAADIVSNLIKK